MVSLIITHSFSIDLSENVRRGMTEKAMKGGYQSRPPYGYCKEETSPIPQVVQEEAKVVRLIFKLFIENKSPWHIAKELNALGLRTRGGNPWERRAVEYILQNPFYKGLVVWNKVRAKQSNRIEELISAKGLHEALVSAEDFELANKILQTQKKTAHCRPSESKKHWLSGILKCSACGSSLSVNLSAAPHFSCGGYKKGKCALCNSLSVKKSENAFELLLKFLSEQIPSHDMRLASPKKIDNEQEIKPLLLLLQKTEKKLERAKFAYTEGIDDIEEYRQNKERLSAEQNELQRKISELSENTHFPKNEQSPEAIALPEAYKMSCSFFINLPTADISAAEKNLLLKRLFDRIVYNKKEGCFDVFFAF